MQQRAANTLTQTEVKKKYQLTCREREGKKVKRGQIKQIAKYCNIRPLDALAYIGGIGVLLLLY